jgi:hypothetical protein
VLTSTAEGGGVEMGQSEVTATSAINAACDRVARIEVMATRFPAASESEVHLRCTTLTLTDGRAGGDAIFTFADDKLILIHARGQADNLRPDMEPVAQFGDFDVYMPQQIIVNVKTGQSAVFGEMPVVPLSVGRSIDEVWLATKPVAQFQIDCFGYEIAGYPRKLEFVFGDASL